jgi:hypothetical protein
MVAAVDLLFILFLQWLLPAKEMDVAPAFRIDKLEQVSRLADVCLICQSHAYFRAEFFFPSLTLKLCEEELEDRLNHDG